MVVLSKKVEVAEKKENYEFSKGENCRLEKAKIAFLEKPADGLDFEIFPAG